MIIILIEGPCLKRINCPKISATAIKHRNIMDELSELRALGIYMPQSSINIFSSVYTRLPRILSIFRTIDPSTSVCFITPLGVLCENDPAICYEECFDELSTSTIRTIFEKFDVMETIYDMLEEDFDLLIFCSSSKLLRVLEIEYYLPANRPSIIVSNAYTTDRSNIYTITLNHYLTSRLRRIYDKIALVDLYQHVLEFIAKALDDLASRGYKLKYLFTRPEDLHKTIFSPEMLDKILRVGRRQDKLLRFIS